MGYNIRHLSDDLTDITCVIIDSWVKMIGIYVNIAYIGFGGGKPHQEFGESAIALFM